MSVFQNRLDLISTKKPKKKHPETEFMEVLEHYSLNI
jgi:hypothetical protein